MALNIPLPNAPTNEGDLLSSLRSINSLRNENLETEINRVKAQYAPLTTRADAASKLAYSNLVGPQFLAKLAGNEHILANLPDDQKRAIIQRAQSAGSGEGAGNMLNNLPQPQNSNGPLSLGWIIDQFKKKINPESNERQQQSSNPLASNGSGFVMPEHPEQKKLEIMSQQPTANQQPIQSGNEKTFAENVGDYKGTVKEGEKTGENRAKDIEELNNVVFNSAAKQDSLNAISDILTNPEMEKIRNVPLAGHHELSYYAKEGTKEQQNLVGQYYSQMGEFVKSSARDFAGQFRKGEQQLLQSMKPNAGDTVDTAKGKVEALSLMTRLLSERSKLTSQIMSKYHINKLQAQESADTQIDAGAIKEEIHNKLNPKITIRNGKTGETMTISANDRKKYGV
jgi:hypothetical protein